MKRTWWIAISCLLAWIGLLSQGTVAQQPQDALVTLPVQVADGAGIPVPDLQLKDFRVSEDDIAQEIRTLVKGVAEGEYILSYYPAPNPNAGKFRHIQVKVLLPNLRLTAKPAYYASEKK